MKRLTIFAATLALAVHLAYAQEPDADVESWRMTADSLVSDGNRAYILSDKERLQAALVRLDHWMQEGARTGLCSTSDSLVYTADLLKLRADWRYECAADTLTALEEAEQLFIRALQVYEDHPELNQAHAATILHEELAQLYFRQQRYPQALAEMDLVVSDFEERIALGEIEADDPLGPEPYNDYLNQLGAKAMCLARCGQYEEAESLLKKAVEAYSDKQSEAYAELLRRRAKVIMLQHETQPDASLLKQALSLYRKCFALQRRLILEQLLQRQQEGRESYWLRVRPFVADAYRTAGADAPFLFNVTLFLKGLLLQVEQWEHKGMDARQMQTALQVHWTDVQRKLQKGESAVEFVTYESKGSQQMGALVLHAQGQPVWVPMPAPSLVTSYEFPTFNDTVEQRISSTSRRRKDGLYSDSTLSAMVWPENLRRELKGCRRVFFAPDAYQHRLAIEYMWPDKKAKVELCRLTSTRRLLERTNASIKVDSALIVGAVDYDAIRLTEPEAANDSLAYGFYHAARVQFPQLDHSGSEVEGISRLRHCEADTLLCGAVAHETAFRQLCGSYPMVFLKPCLTDHTLSENVVALAGVNPSLLADGFDAGGRADGLLSAWEMSRLDMHKVGLFIISACQTGLGFITSDGVYGIQRGLKQAGTGAMMLSLWSVHDEATALLMQAFQQALMQGRSAHEALAQAQAALRGESFASHEGPASTQPVSAARMRFNPSTLSQEPVPDEDEVLYDSPQYTHAFILIDALPPLATNKK